MAAARKTAGPFYFWQEPYNKACGGTGQWPLDYTAVLFLARDLDLDFMVSCLMTYLVRGTGV